MNRIGFDQPYVAIDSRAFIEPSVAGCCVNAYQQHVASAGRREVGEIEAEWIVSSTVSTDVEIVADHHRLAIRAIELDGDTFTFILGSQFEQTPIPTDAGSRVFLSQWIETLRPQRRIILERELDSPVMRQIQFAPLAVVERQRARGNEVARFLKTPGEPKVLIRITGVPKMEAPAKIQKQPLPSGALHSLVVH